MQRKSIGYHTRSALDGVKLTGGCFGGEIDQTTVERLVKAHFTVKARPSGSLTFVDRQGREVWLYLTVHPETTAMGQAALRELAKLREAEQAAQKALEDELEGLLDSMTTEEALRRLRG